uniref:hydroxysqualene dehydroxylase n=1 Tax=Nocardia stercoris TaxID=2483361 RepID=UPI002D76B624|nr:FAD-dependent oxidoreductase [Nocardia stercoris]
MTRRAVLRGAMGVGAGVAAGALCSPVATANTGPSVAIFGGGVAGLTAAHELAERGFAVTVYERRALGGKARSIPFTGTGTGGRPDLPGEHGFRFFPGFYHHLPDTMRRIPFAGNVNGVWDNLISTPEARFARKDADSTFVPTSYSDIPWSGPGEFQQTLGSMIATSAKMPPADAAYFANRLLVFFTSCDDRRLGQWEKVAWRDFVGANERSEDFRILLSRTLTTMLVAMSDDQASTRTIGTMGEQFLGNPLWQGNDGPMDRVLNGPTNQAWIDPWVDRLRGLGVTFVTAELAGLDIAGSRISGARLTDGTPVTADHYLLAVPAEVARTFWTPEILSLQPELANMSWLNVEWMTGIQFYLNRPANIARGHTAYVDSPWSLTSISQNQFWARTELPAFGDGTVQDCLSVDISNWNLPGVLYGKPARDCNHDEIAREVWEQVKQHLVGDSRLSDADLHSWFLDPGVAWDANRSVNTNADPLLVNTVGTWSARPAAHGAVDNLFLAGDYVQTTIDLATMEGANESARAAVNALLDVTGSSAPRCRMFSLFRSPILEPLRQADIARYAAGQPNQFDTA